MLDDARTHYLLLSQLKAALKTDSPLANERLRRIVGGVSRALELETNRRFDHRAAVVYHDARTLGFGGDVNGSALYLADDLQAVESISRDGDVFDPASYELLAEPERRRCYDRVDLVDSTLEWRSSSDRPERVIVVAGIWGYGGRWRSTGLTLAGALDTSAAQVALSGVTGLEREMLLRVDDEYLRIDADVDASPISVERAVNGTAAAAHDSGTPVDSFEVDAVVRDLVLRLALWRLELEKSPAFGQITIGDADYPIDISSAPKDITRAIAMLTRSRKQRLISTSMFTSDGTRRINKRGGFA